MSGDFPTRRRHLETLADEVQRRCADTVRGHDDWPCSAGCDHCCRSLAAVPELTHTEWEVLRPALIALPDEARASVASAADARRRAGDARPIVCPLLDPSTGLCRVYEARPLACRTYGFYADRDGVLGCAKIADVAEQRPDIVWGHHDAIVRAQDALGERRTLLVWMDDESL